MAEPGYSFIIATSWNPNPVCDHFRLLAKRLGQRGHHVSIVVDGQRHDVEDHLGNPAVFTWPSRRPTRPRDALFMTRLIRQDQPHCMVANFGATNIMVAAGWMSRVPVRVAWYRTLSSQIRMDAGVSAARLLLQRSRKKIVYRLCTHMVANSEATRADAREVFGIPAEKLTVWPNTVADPLPEVRHVPGADYLVCVGRLQRSKGQDVVIRSLPPLLDAWPLLRVRFIGAGPEADALKRLADELGVGGRCEFTGALPHDHVLREMAGACAVIVPSRSEAFGIVNIEALAVGTPVIASSVGGIVEIVRDGSEGLLVPAEDPQALAGAIRYLLTYPERAREMGVRARRRFEAEFEQSAVVERQVDWLIGLVAERAGAQRESELSCPA